MAAAAVEQPAGDDGGAVELAARDGAQAEVGSGPSASAAAVAEESAEKEAAAKRKKNKAAAARAAASRGGANDDDDDDDDDGENDDDEAKDETKREAKRPVASRLHGGCHSLQGRRRTMEDRTSVLEHPQFNEDVKLTDNVPRSFYAVYDGHGGHVCAEYCRRHVHHNVTRDPHFKRDPRTALHEGVVATDRNFNEAARNLNLTASSGTCAIVAYVQEDLLLVANVGDSRCVLCRRGRAVDLSVDHKPGRPDERARIQAHGGTVARSEHEAFNGGACTWIADCLCGCMATTPLRVYPGGLSVTRAIGDIGLKATRLIVPEPELQEHRLDFDNDEFLILGCDGVWDVLSSQQAVSCVKAELDRQKTATDASATLARLAYEKGSTDNISVVVVVLG